MSGRTSESAVALTPQQAAVLKAAREYVEAVNRYESEIRHDDSGQLACGTGMLVVDRLAALRAAVDGLPKAEG